MNTNKDENNRQPCKIFSRVNGWYTSIDSWNKGKLSEWRDRKEYVVEDKKEKYAQWSSTSGTI